MCLQQIVSHTLRNLFSTFHFTKDEVQNQKDGIIFSGLGGVAEEVVGKPPFLSPFFKDGRLCSAVSKQHPQRKHIRFIGIT